MTENEILIKGIAADVYMEHFHCVELISKKSEISGYPTRWGAARRCHDLNKWNPQERWTVEPVRVRYVPIYNEVTTISFKTSLKRHFESVKGKTCTCLFCRNLNKRIE